MAKIDRLKEQIGYLKVIFGILVAILVSVIGWFASHYDEITVLDIRTVLSFMLVVILSVGIVYINKQIIHYINELEDL